MENSAVGIPKSEGQMGEVLPQFQINERTLERARDYVMGSKTLFESQRTDKVVTFRKADRAYRFILESDRPYKGFDDKASPIVHDNVEAIIARLKESILFNKDNLVKIKSKQMPNELKSGREDQINDQMQKQDIEDRVEGLVRTTTKFGTGFLKCVYLNTGRQVLTRQIVNEEIPILDVEGNPVLDANRQPMVQIKQTVKVMSHEDSKYEGPSYEPIKDTEDIYLDMFIEDIDDQPIVIHRVIVDWDHLLDGVQAGVYFPEQVKKIKDKSYNTAILNASRSEDINGTTASGATPIGSFADGKPKEYELFQAYCEFSLSRTDNGSQEFEEVHNCVITVCNNEVIQLNPNPYFHQMKPIIKTTYRRVEGEAYGIGAIDPIIDLFAEYNDLMNVKNDSRALAVNPIKIQRGGSLSDKQDLEVFPGVTWVVQEPGDITFANFNWEPINQAEQSLELLEQRINRGMGITPQYQGQSDSGDVDKTWRGTNKLINQTDKKFKMIAKGIEDSAIRKWAEMAYKVNVQFTPSSMGLGFEHINSEIGFTVSGVESYFEKQEEIQNLQAFITQFGSVEGFNVVGLVLKLADLLKVTIDEEKYGPLYQKPQGVKREEKPINVTTSIPLDPSKGAWMKYAAAQVLAEKGIQIDLDATRSGQQYDFEDDPNVKIESGNLPPQKDSYPKSDPRTK